MDNPIVPYDGGKARIKADLTTALGLILFRYGLDDPDIELVCRLLRPGDAFVDGGANIGLFTLAAASRVGPTGHVISFEPATATRRALLENLRLNDFSWVQVHPDALSDREATARLTVFGRQHAGLSSFRPAHANGEVEEVRTVTLDGALASLTPKLIKLDLEGAEYAAMLGARELLRSRASIFYVEVEDEHLKRQGASQQMLCDLFAKAGYEMFSVRRTSDAKFVATPGIDGAAASPNLLAVADRSMLADADIRVDASSASRE